MKARTIGIVAALGLGLAGLVTGCESKSGINDPLGICDSYLDKGNREGYAEGYAACLARSEKQKEQAQLPLPQQEPINGQPIYNEEITNECIKVQKGPLFASSGAMLRSVSLTWCRGAHATMHYRPQDISIYGESFGIADANNLLGDKIISCFHDSVGFIGMHSPENDSSRADEQIEWKYICQQLDCEGLLEKQEKLRNEQE